MTARSEPFLAVARLLRPQGRRGELLAEPLSDLTGIFDPGRCFRSESSVGSVAAPAGNATGLSWTLESVWTPTGRNAGRLVLKLSGVDSISAAEDLAGLDLCIAESDLPARDPDTFLVRDLLNCTLHNGDTPVGRVIDLQFATGPDDRARLQDAAPLLVVEPLSSTGVNSEVGEAPEPFLVPFVKAWLEHVDLANRSIRMNLPEGLIAP